MTEKSPQASTSPVDRGALLLAALEERRLECNMSYMDMYRCIPEVFFTIEYIASRIAGGNFILKKEKDDSVVWSNKTVNDFLNHPN